MRIRVYYIKSEKIKHCERKVTTHPSCSAPRLRETQGIYNKTFRARLHVIGARKIDILNFVFKFFFNPTPCTRPLCGTVLRQVLEIIMLECRVFEKLVKTHNNQKYVFCLQHTCNLLNCIIIYPFKNIQRVLTNKYNLIT